MLDRKKALSLCAAAAMAGASLFATASAFAQSRPVTVTAPRDTDLVTRKVSYQDLNLASIGDQRALDRRVGVAVKDVCQYGEYQDARTFNALTHYRDCSAIAWDGARPQIAAAVTRAQALALGGEAPPATASMAIGISVSADR